MSEINIKKLFLLFEKMKKDKKTLMIVALAFTGILMIFISELTPEENDKPQEIAGQSSYIAENEREELEHIIASIRGVGRVKVMLTYEGTAENVYASDISEKVRASETDTDKEHIILDKGNTEDGLLIKALYPQVTGVAVVCEGGSSPTVKNDITQLLKALYKINSNNISISEMNA